MLWNTVAILLIIGQPGPAPPGTALMDVCPNGDVWVSVNDVVGWNLEGLLDSSAEVNMPMAGGVPDEFGERREGWPFTYTDLYLGKIATDPADPNYEIVYRLPGGGGVVPARYPASCHVGHGTRLPESYPPNNTLLDFGDVHGSEVFPISVYDRVFRGKLAEYKLGGVNPEAFQLTGFAPGSGLENIHNMNLQLAGVGPGEYSAHLDITVSDPEAHLSYDIRANVVATEVVPRNTASATYNFVTGEVTVSSNQIVYWGLVGPQLLASRRSFTPFSATESTMISPGITGLQLDYSWMIPGIGGNSVWPSMFTIGVPVVVVPEPLGAEYVMILFAYIAWRLRLRRENYPAPAVFPSNVRPPGLVTQLRYRLCCTLSCVDSDSAFTKSSYASRSSRVSWEAGSQRAANRNAVSFRGSLSPREIPETSISRSAG